MENIFVEFLPPWVETGLQPAFYDKESGTVLQQTARMYARVNMLIRMFNKLSKQTKEEVERFEGVVNDTVEEYIEKFNDLHDYVHDYFDNLDVQEEINNKLDAMVEAGTLQEIIDDYLQPNVAWTFDSVADMKSSENLIDGTFAQTFGYYNVNDKGGAKYKIRNKTNDDVIDEMFLIAIGDTLVAELTPGEQISTRQIGIVGDGTTDESSKLKAFFAYNINKYIINSPNILIDDDIIITSNSTIEFEDGCKITRKPTDNDKYFMLQLDNVENVTINNAWLVGDRADHTGATGEWGHGINIVCSKNVEVLNSKIEYTWGDGIYIGLWNTTVGTYVQPENIRVSGCIIDHCSRNGISACSGSNIIIENTTISNTNRTNPQAGIDIELEAPAGQTPYFENLVIRNVTTSENTEGINIYCTSTYDAGTITIDNHHSYKERRGVKMLAFHNANSTFIYTNSYIELAWTSAIYLHKQNVNKAIFRDIIIDSSTYDSLSDTQHGCVMIQNDDTNNTDGGFVFENIRVTKTHSNQYIWGVFLMSNSSTQGSIEDIVVKNVSSDKPDNIGFKPIFISNSGGSVDFSKVTFVDCVFAHESLGNEYTIDANAGNARSLLYKGDLWAATTTTINAHIPDGDYEIAMRNKSTFSHTITFANDYTVYNGINASSTLRTFTAGYSGSNLKFRKKGSLIYITGNIGYTVS